MFYRRLFSRRQTNCLPSRSRGICFSLAVPSPAQNFRVLHVYSARFDTLQSRSESAAESYCRNEFTSSDETAFGHLRWSSSFDLLHQLALRLLPIAVPSQVDPTGRSGEPPPLPKQFEAPAQPPGTLLPPTPIPPQATPFPGLRVFVREIRVVGSTVFSPEDLAKVTDPYI